MFNSFETLDEHMIFFSSELNNIIAILGLILLINLSAASNILLFEPAFKIETIYLLFKLFHYTLYIFIY